MLSLIEYIIPLNTGGIFMTDSFFYETGREKIAQQNMQFSIIHLRPRRTPDEKETEKAAISNQLFEIFSKYPHACV